MFTLFSGRSNVNVRALCRFCRHLKYVQGQSPTPNTREYFYYIDHQGQLFLDDTRVKNFITCFKDKKFLAFFFRRLKINSTERYADEFPFISPCGKEMNYIRCDDVPLVFTHILDEQGEVILDIHGHASTPLDHIAETVERGRSSIMPDRSKKRNQTEKEGKMDIDNAKTHQTKEVLSYGGTGKLLTVPFQPERLFMLPESGRIYHSGPLDMGGVGLVKSSLAIELSRYFQYKEGADPEEAAPMGFTWRGQSYTLDNYVALHLNEMHR